MAPLIDPDLDSPDRRVLITGGVRSGKSRYAETLLADLDEVTYVASGPVPDPAADAEWAARIADHRVRRPQHWSTVETTDVAGAVDLVLTDFAMPGGLGSELAAQIRSTQRWVRVIFMSSYSREHLSTRS